MSELPEHPIKIINKWADKVIKPRVESFMEAHPETAERVINASLKSMEVTDRLKASIGQKLGNLFRK